MAKQTVNIGQSANDRTGDSLRTSFEKINSNFTELYTELGLVGDTDLNLGSFEFTGSTLTTTDSSAIVIDQAASITGDFTVGGDIVPNVTEEHSLGSPTKRFKDIYLSGSTIDLGGTTLSIADGKLQVGGADVGSTVSYNEITDTPTIPGALSDLTNDSGFITANDIPTDFKGSVFADDSSLLVDGVNSKINLQNTVLNDTISTSDENFFINTAATPGDRGFTNITTTDNILDIQGAAALPGGQGGGIYINGGIPFDDPSDYTRYGDIIISGRIVSILAGDGEDGGGLAIAGPVIGTTTMDINGSVFGDDSTVLVDGVNGRVAGSIINNTIDVEEESDFTINTSGEQTDTSPVAVYNNSFIFSATGELIFDSAFGEIKSSDSGTLTIEYVNSTPGHWNGNPGDIKTALDRIAAAIYSLNGGNPI